MSQSHVELDTFNVDDDSHVNGDNGPLFNF